MALCGDIFYYSLCNTEKDTITSFFKDCSNEIELIEKEWHETDESPKVHNFLDKFGDTNAIRGIPYLKNLSLINGIYNRYIPSNIPEEYQNFYITLFEAIRVAGLLHDIGHPPFSHVVEYGLGLAYKDVKKSSSLHKALYDILQKNNEIHEEIGNTIFDSLSKSFLQNVDQNDAKCCYYYLMVFDLSEKILNNYNTFFKDIHRIVAGSLDGDRLDNINRDSFMTGFNRELINYNYFVNSMVLVGDSENGYMFCPDIKTLTSIEECFSKRWKNYRCMTHHHKVIKTNYMLQMIVYYLATEYCDNEGNTKQSDALFLPYDISGLWLPMTKTSVNKLKINRFIQWNDNWLMTVLQKKYLEMFLDDNKAIRSTPLYYFLEELIENKHNYRSIVKRYEDYAIIDQTFHDDFAKYFKDIVQQYQEFDKNINDEEREKRKTDATTSNIDKFIKSFAALDFDCTSGAFISSKIAFLVSLFTPKDNLFDIIGKNIKDEFLEKYKYDLDDCFIVAKKLKIGTDSLLSLYDTRTKKSKKFVDISHIDQTLRAEHSYIPEFYVYAKWKNNQVVQSGMITQMQKDLGKIASKCVNDFIDKTFVAYLQNE